MEATREELQKELLDEDGKWFKAQRKKIIESTKDMLNILTLMGKLDDKTLDDYYKAVDELARQYLQDIIDNTKDEDLSKTSTMMTLFGGLL